MRLLNASEIRALLGTREAIRVMRQAYTDYDATTVDCPPRTIISTAAPEGYFGVMPVMVGAERKFVVKIAGLVVADQGCQMEAVVAVMDANTAQLLALLDGESLTTLRTSATAALVSDLLADPHATSLALLGTGRQAAALLLAHCLIRPISRVKVYARNPEKLHAFVTTHRQLLGPEVEICAVDSVSQAVQGAQIICTATSADRPLIRLHDIVAGCHIAAIGNHAPDFCELDDCVLNSAVLVTDDRVAASKEAPAILAQATEIQSLLQNPALLLELQELRQHGTPKVTAYLSVGSAFQDATMATALLHAARQQATGVDWLAGN
ncbi:hypothetical protein A5320_05190 [Rheinheimera sp. SA_1]|uniref:ornithine cyclodeaminase family protein n=1 Tax=Rheinheimera sp. SA_1 TaxID=1827365 RepID=UPI0008013E2B|nr:ornithine cyclodeaminase family protein [Rheinheimera sp. SA_1]OBP16771.1 hypothetical protein A5320_05190 [Rheinheimera sp. SA_1]